MAFCQNCGKEVNENAKFCAACGAQRGSTPAGMVVVSGKSQTISVLLAVFLGYWTWLYTYGKDAWKFWVGLGISLFIFIFAVITFGISAFFTWFVPLIIWVWAIVDTAMKKSDWYTNYYK